jgi:hypothetical protein
MSNVIEMPPPSVAGPTPPHRGLRLLSRSLAVLFTVFAALQVLLLLAALIATLFFGDHVLASAAGFSVYTGKPPAVRGMVLYASQSALTHTVGLMVLAIGAAPILVMFWNLRGLFWLYADGIVFARENAAHLKRIGLCLVAYPVATITGNMVFRLAGGLDKVWFHMELVYALVLGLIVLVIAQIMEFGQEIELDRSEII